MHHEYQFFYYLTALFQLHNLYNAERRCMWTRLGNRQGSGRRGWKAI